MRSGLVSTEAEAATGGEDEGDGEEDILVTLFDFSTRDQMNDKRCVCARVIPTSRLDDN